MNRLVSPLFYLVFLLMLLTGCALFKPRSALVQEQNETVIAGIQTDYPQLFLQPTEERSTISVEETVPPLAADTPLLQNPTVISGTDQAMTKTATAEPSLTVELTKTALPEMGESVDNGATLTAGLIETEVLPATETVIKPSQEKTEISLPARENTPQATEIAPDAFTQTIEVPTVAATATSRQFSATPEEPAATALQTQITKIVPMVAITPLIPVSTTTFTPTPKKDGPVLISFEAPAYAATLSGTLTADQPDVYTFLAKEGQYLRLRLIASGKDVKLGLSHADGDLSLPDNLQPDNLVIRIPKEGWYSLMIRMNDEVQNASTDYSLQLALPDKLTLTKNVSVLHLQDELEANGSWRFTAQVEKDFLLQLKLSVPEETKYQLRLIDLELGDMVEIEDSRSIDWLSEKGSGRTYLVELLNGSGQAVFDLTLEQMREIGL